MTALSQLLPSLEPNVWGVIGAMWGALVIGTIIRAVWLWLTPPSEDAAAKRASLQTWWGLVTLLTTVVLGGPYAICLALAVVSMLGMREFLAITANPRRDRYARAALYGSLATFYLAVTTGWVAGLWLITILYVPLLLWMYHEGEPSTEVLRQVWVDWRGLFLLAFCLSHAAVLFTHPLNDPSYSLIVSRFLFLVLLTESNDISQALWGRTFGKHKITPRLSPHKTWEGFLGGMTTTILLSLFLGWVLQPFGEDFGAGWWAAAGLLIAGAGFAGDLTFSAFKRAAGVKDSGDLLPGMGGVLDRIDSLTLTAPLFYYYLAYIVVAGIMNDRP